MKLAVDFNNTWTVTSSAEDRSGQTALGIAVNLAGQSGFGPLRNFRFIFCCGREHIYQNLQSSEYMAFMRSMRVYT